MNTRRIGAAAATVLLLGSALPAYLVRRIGTGADIRWDLSLNAPNLVAGKVTYFIDKGSAEDVTGEEFAAAVRSAVRSWEDADATSIAFEEDLACTTAAKNASDKVNRFGFTAGVLPPFAFAAAFTAIQGSRITDVDVVFNPQMTWSVVTPGDPSKADVEAVTAHEWGHGIGIDHVPLVRSTMYYAAGLGQLSLRSLETDDVAGAARSYPAATLDATRGRIRGRVDVAGTADDRGIQVTAIDFATGFPAASSMTEPSGDYEILGLPPGAYRVVASPMGTDKIAQGVFSPYWDTAATAVLPAIRGQGGAADGSTGAHVLAAGQVLEGVDLAVGPATNPFEPNGTTGSAAPLPLGRSAAARIETTNDHDVFSFAGIAGRKVSAFVHAGQLGSDLDPRIYLRGPTGLLLATNDDISAAYLSVAGADADARILDFTLPMTATYFVEIEPAVSVTPGFPEDYFYVLTLLEGGAGAASPATSSIAASPAAVPADGVSTTVVTFRPRTLQGTAPAAGTVVTFELAADGDADGTPTAAVNQGDGTWTTTVTAPASPGSDVVRGMADGVEILAVAVNWRGPADFAASGFGASPRRIRFDGASTATLVLVPRDASGIPVGPGRTVALALDGSPGASLGGTVDRGDGSYAATLTAGTEEEALGVGAAVDGAGLAGSYAAGVGFPAGPVVDDAVEDLAEALAADPLPPAKAAAKLAAARNLLAAAAALPGEDPLPLVTAAQKALKQIEAARKKGRDAADVARELVEAARQAARAALDAAAPLADTPAEAGRLAKAEAAFVGGEALLDCGSRSKAAGKYRAALKTAVKVQ
jgi:hypothetical protein